MNKLVISIVAVVGLLTAGFFAFNSYIYNEKQADPVTVTDYKNAAYVIDGQVVTLVNGFAESEIVPNSASKIVTRYFGNELFKDLNDDGIDDVVFILTQETRGSGTFFYVVAALNTVDGYVGSQALLLGDRIAPQTTEPGPGKQVIVNFAERGIDEPMTTPPSFGKSLHLILDPQSMQFGEVVQNFEGEADPNIMTLGMKTWTWVKTIYNNDTELEPKDPNAFKLTFDDGTFSATTDCNSMSGVYEVENKQITFGNIASTAMFCENSQEQEFSSMLNEAHAFFFTTKGELVFDLKFDSGSAIFR